MPAERPAERDHGAHEDIRQVALRYARGVDRLDADLIKSAYWPDAIDDHGRFTGLGWELADRVVVTHTRWAATMHCVMNHAIEIEEPGDLARGEIYNITYLIPPAGEPWSVWLGRYLDRYERRDGEWRISHRICVHEATTTLESLPMPGDHSGFRSGSVDRGEPYRPLGD